MTRALLVVASLAAAGCCAPAPDLAVEGEPAPGYEIVLRVAQEHCDRAIVGRLEWRELGVALDDTGTRHVNGQCDDQFDCPLDAWVARRRDGNPAVSTSEAHEIGHWCLRSKNEDLVRAWADIVNDEATAITSDPSTGW